MWQPIETAQKGIYVDLWCVGDASDISFYCAGHSKVKGVALWQGRATDWRLDPDGKWRAAQGLGLPLSIKPTHWQPLPDPPESAASRATGEEDEGMVEVTPLADSVF